MVPRLPGGDPVDRLPLHLKVYTAVAVAFSLGASETWFSSKLRFLLPAVLLPMAGAVAIATTWFGLYLSVIAKLPP